VDLEIAFVNEGVGPGKLLQRALADGLTSSLQEQMENIHRPASKLDGLPFSKEQLLSRHEPERAKDEYGVFAHDAHSTDLAWAEESTLLGRKTKTL
jgi:hypothetical protein